MGKISIGTGGRSSGGGSGGIGFETPPRVFTGATVAACRTARNTFFANVANVSVLAKYQADQHLGIILRPTTGSQVIETYFTGEQGKAYSADKWIDRGASAATDAHIDSRIATPARAVAPSGTFVDARIPATIARDSELAPVSAVANAAQNQAKEADTKATANSAIAQAARDTAQANAGAVTTEVATRASGDDLQAIEISSASSYQSDLNAQLNSDQPLEVLITADISGTRGGSPYSYKNGDVLYFAPRSDSPEFKYNIRQGGSSGGDVQDASITPPKTVTKGLFTQDIYDFLAARDKWASHGISSAAQLHQILTDSSQMKLARLLIFEDNINEVHQTITYAHKRNLVGYALPGETSVTDLFRLTDTKIKHAGTASELTALLTQHVTENTDLFVFINAGFRHSGTTYAKWTLVSFKPKSVTPVVELNLARQSTSIRIEPPSIAAPTDLDGDYVLFLGELPYSNAEVDQLEIWIKDEAVHSVSNFAPESGPFVVPFNVSTDEETQVGLTNSDDYARILAVYRKGGQYVGQDTTVLAVKNQVPKSTGGGTELTSQQKAEVIDVRITPTVVIQSDLAFKTFKLTSDDPSILGASVWVNTIIAGQRTDRQRLTGAELTFTYSDIVSTTISQNIPPSDRYVRIDIELWDAESAGNSLAVLRRDVTLQRGQFSPRQLFSGNVTTDNANFIELAATWPADIEFCVMAVNEGSPATDYEGVRIFRNPRLGNAMFSDTPVTTASSRDKPSEENSIGVSFNNSTAHFFGRTSDNKILYAPEAAGLDPSPLQIGTI